MDIVAPGDLAELVSQAGAAGDTGDQATGLFEHALKHALRATHFPQHVAVDRALAARDVIGAPDLFDRTVDRVLDQFLMALAARQGATDLRAELAFGVMAVGLDRRHGAVATTRRPGDARHMIGPRCPLPPLPHRPNYLPPL